MSGKGTPTALYLIALAPPPDIAARQQAIKQDIYERYGAKYALNKPAHITLQPPLKLPEQHEQQLVDALKTVAAQHHPFQVYLKDFNHFSNRVVFIDVVQYEAITHLHRALTEQLSTLPFITDDALRLEPIRPHMTIANRDLKQGRFNKIWQAYRDRSFSHTFTAKDITLYKHNGKVWEVFCEAGFGQAGNQ